MLSYSAPATSISTKGHTIPRPFFGRCLAPSTCEADRQRWGEDCLPDTSILTAEAGGAIKEENVPWRQHAPCWALKVLAIRSSLIHSRASCRPCKPEPLAKGHTHCAVHFTLNPCLLQCENLLSFFHFRGKVWEEVLSPCAPAGHRLAFLFPDC